MSQNDTSPKVSSSENRRSSKPIMEKRRRARINSSLAELKALLIDVLKNEGTHHSKMEKADILEMTVKHLRQIQRQQFAVAAAVDPTIINKYQVGFNECATEVARYLSSIEGLDIELRSRLLNHLANCLQMQNIQRSESTAVFGPNAVFPAGNVNHTTPIQWRRVPSPPKLATVFKTANNDVYAQKIMTSGINANAMLTGGIQLLPTRLPTGETAFIIPGGIKAEDVRLNNYVIPVYSQSANRNVSPTSAPQNSTTDTRCLVTNNNEKRLLADPRSSSMQHLTDTKQCVIENITPPPPPPPEIDSKIAPPEQVKIEHVWRPW